MLLKQALSTAVSSRVLLKEERVAPVLTELGTSFHLWGTRHEKTLGCLGCTDGIARNSADWGAAWAQTRGSRSNSIRDIMRATRGSQWSTGEMTALLQLVERWCTPKAIAVVIVGDHQSLYQQLGYTVRDLV